MKGPARMHRYAIAVPRIMSAIDAGAMPLLVRLDDVSVDEETRRCVAPDADGRIVVAAVRSTEEAIAWLRQAGVAVAALERRRVAVGLDIEIDDLADLVDRVGLVAITGATAGEVTVYDGTPDPAVPLLAPLRERMGVSPTASFDLAAALGLQMAALYKEAGEEI